MPHICISESGQHWFRQRLVAYSVPSHYLNQCWKIVNWTLRNKIQWNLNRNSYVFIQENASENIVCEMAAILSRGRWVNTLYQSSARFGIINPTNVIHATLNIRAGRKHSVWICIRNACVYNSVLSKRHWLTHCGRVTHYGDGSMLCKSPIFFTMK